MSKTSSQRGLPESALKPVKLCVMDVDGVLTDGSIYVGDSGEETKRFNVWDGAGITLLHRAGIKTAIISSRSSPAVEGRARELGITELWQGVSSKRAAMESLLKAVGFTGKEICYIGDDLNDIPVMQMAGVSVAVANARPEVKRAATVVTEAKGGEGAIREIAEAIIRAQGKWESVVESCSGDTEVD